jgi:hypothetical protein
MIVKALLFSSIVLLTNCTAWVKPTETKAKPSVYATVFKGDSVYANVLKQPVTLDVKNGRLPEIFDKLYEQTDVFFEGTYDEWNGAGLFTIHCRHLALRECLALIAGQNHTIKFLIPADQVPMGKLVIDAMDSNWPEDKSDYLAPFLEINRIKQR